MAFRFPLATLLRLKEIAEDREERLLGQILNQMVQARQTLADLAARRLTVISRRESALQQQTSAAEIAVFYGELKTIEDLEVQGKEHLVKLEGLRMQQMKAYEVAHRNRELLSGMREQQLDHFQREQTRQEQNQMDDNFSSRRNFR